MSAVADAGRQAKKRVFLEAFAEVGTVTHAAEAAGISRTLHYDWLKDDPEYARQFEDAQEKAIDALEAAARQRAIYGTEEPVFHRGKIVGSVHRHSDTLLIFLLKGARPHKYRERVDVTVSVRQQAEKIAGELGVSVDEVIAEANRIVAEAQREGTPA